MATEENEDNKDMTGVTGQMFPEEIEAELTTLGIESSSEAKAEDIVLMEGVRRRDAQSLQRLFELYGAAAAAVVQRATASYDFEAYITEDLLVDSVTLAFEDIISNADWWNPDRGWSLPTWFCTRALQRFRRLADREFDRQRLAIRLLRDGANSSEDMDDPEHIALRSMERDETVQKVRDAIERLPAALRAPLVLSLQDVLYVDIAARLGIASEDAVKQRIYRAKRILKKDLGGRTE